MPPPDHSTARWRRLLFVVLVPLVALVSLVTWGLSSPVGSSPDDDFHLASIWCGHGPDGSRCAPGDADDEMSVPGVLITAASCFAFDKDADGTCRYADFSRQDLTSTDRGNFDNQYPPVFYWTMSWFASPNIEASVIAMRVVNSVLFVGLVTAAFLLLPLRRRIPLLWAAAVSVVPLGMFIIPSTNPSSWAILSGATLWITLVGYYEAEGGRRIALGALAALAALLGAGARADAAVFVGVAAVVAGVIAFERSRRFVLLSILPVALVIGALLFYLTANQASAVETGLSAAAPPTLVELVQRFIGNSVLIPGLWAGIFGIGFGLGWLDTPLPAAVAALAFAAFAISVFMGLRSGSPRKWIASAIVFLAAWIFPTVILVRTGAIVGAYVQPRYVMPLLIMLVGVLLLGVIDRARLSLAQRYLLVAGLALANALALWVNLRRYVTGLDVTQLNLDVNREWWWSGVTFTPMAVLIVGSFAFAAFLVLAERAFARIDRDPQTITTA